MRLRSVSCWAGVVATACGGVAGPGVESAGGDAVRVCAAGATIDGIDVSEHQGLIDWNAVAASGIRFAIVRISDGDYRDRTFDRNWPEVARVGMVRGAYQFFRAAEDPELQASIVVAKVGVLGPNELPVTLDIEDASMQGLPAHVILDRARRWIAAVTAGTGKAPLIYTGKYIWNSAVGSREFGDTPLWIAAYGASCPDTPEGWDRWAIWQYSSEGRVPGIRGDTDLNLFNGSMEDLLRLARGPEAPSERGPRARGNIAANSDGRLELFVRAADGSVEHIWQTSPNGVWSDWAGRGGEISSTPVLERNTDGRLESFVRGTDGAIYHAWQKSPGGEWSDWSRLGGWSAGAPAASRNADGRLEIFATGAGGEVFHAWQKWPGGEWSEWVSRGGRIEGTIAVGMNADGRMELFARSAEGSLHHIWQLTPSGEWGEWSELGGELEDGLAVASNADGRLEIFVRGRDGAVYHKWQRAPNADWSDWGSLGGSVASITAASNADGRVELFARGTDGAVYHRWQLAGGGWSDWGWLGGELTGAISVLANADGRLELFARGLDGAVYNKWQLAPNSAWSDWGRLGGDVSPF